MEVTFAQYLPAASFFMAAVALGLSVVAAFPGLKNVIAAVRDGILWLALFFVLGGAAYIGIHAMEVKRQHAQEPAERSSSFLKDRPSSERSNRER